MMKRLLCKNLAPRMLTVAWGKLKVLSLLGVVSGSMFCSVGFADPTETDVTASLDVHQACQHSGQLAAACAQIDNLLTPRMPLYQQAIATPEKLPINELGPVYAKAMQLQRYAALLVINAEPAGVDYQLRAQSHLKTVRDAFEAARTTERGKRQSDQARQRLEQQMPAIQKLGKELESLAARSQWSVAEAKYQAGIDSLYPLLGWLTGSSTRKYVQPLAITSKIDAALRPVRIEAAKQQLTAAIQAVAPDVGSLATDMETAVREVGDSGTCTIGGKTLSGPEAILVLVNRWHAMSVACARCRAIEWAAMTTGLRFPTPAGYGDARGETEDPGGRWLVAIDETRAYMHASLAQLIEADAKRVSAGEALALYRNYIDAIAQASQQLPPKDRYLIFDAALDSLVAKTGDAAATISGERAASRELLRWRGRVADAEAGRRQNEFVPLARAFRKQTAEEGGYRGFVPPIGTPQHSPRLRAALTETMPESATRLLGQNVSTAAARPFTIEGVQFVSRYDGEAFATVKASVDLEPFAESLRQDLRLSPDQAPWSWDAIAALNSTHGRAGGYGQHFAAVGGPIRAIRIRSMITGIAANPAIGNHLDCGEVPVRGAMDDFELGRVMLECEVEAQWVQHEYFVADVPKQ
ncbi:hypothetical protein EC9_52470 [Rosistilla ulvae]|uniref:Uncharacterized protein n=1 Tax=Rosistilla ulvae TaxID=1930277 RepID=A0A517M802_9BACT|nr:hypothetical protein [Rosistilla ulvae]QDS91028.1 hypothetical protein EC9_52470 [Rosistilla ulvae]